MVNVKIIKKTLRFNVKMTHIKNKIYGILLILFGVFIWLMASIPTKMFFNISYPITPLFSTFSNYFMLVTLTILYIQIIFLLYVLGNKIFLNGANKL